MSQDESRQSRLYIGSASASPTARPAHGCGRAGASKKRPPSGRELSSRASQHMPRRVSVQHVYTRAYFWSAPAVATGCGASALDFWSLSQNEVCEFAEKAWRRLWPCVRPQKVGTRADVSTAKPLGLRWAPLESSRRGDRSECQHAHTRAQGMPSAMPMQSRYRDSGVLRIRREDLTLIVALCKHMCVQTCVHARV